MEKSVVLHEALLYEEEPYSVECMALDEKQGILAVARRVDYGEERKRESLLEFWNVIKRPVFHVKTRKLGSGGVEALLWINSVLLSSHLDGSIITHQLHSAESLRTQVSSSPLWSLTGLTDCKFCAGSDSGGIFFLSLDGGRITIERTVNIGFGLRVLSLASNGTVVVAGSLDTVSIIDAPKAKILHTLKLPRTEKRKPTIVWCLGFLNDVLVSGDSRGCLCFWNVKNGVLFQTIESHQADILTLCVSNDTLCAAGVDPSIVQVVFDQNRKGFRINHKWNFHTNDVRALVFCGSRLFSGGAQHQLFVSTLTSREVALKTPTCCYLPKKNFVLYQYAKFVVIWLLGIPKDEPNKKGDYLLLAKPVKLAKIVAAEKEYILSSALNEDGGFLAISTRQSVTLYKTSLAELNYLNVNEHSISVRKLSELSFSASSMKFANEHLFLATGSLKLCCIECEKPDFVTTVTSRESSGEALKICVCGEPPFYQVAILTTRNEVLYKSAKSDEFRRLDLKRIDSPIMDIQFVTDKSLFLLCASLECAVFECFPETNSLKMKEKELSIQQLGSGQKSNYLFMLNKNDYIQSMHAASWGLCLVSAYGSVRFLVTVKGKRGILYEETNQNKKRGEERACSVQWIKEGCVLLTIPRAASEPLQGGFTIKRYRQN